MPVEFVRQDVCENGKCASTRLTLDYDGSGRRISKTVWRKAAGKSGWTKDNVTHYTGIGTEVRENFAGSTPGAKVVVSLPEGLGRYAPGDASENADARPLKDENGNELAGMLPGTNFEWYLKNYQGESCENALVYFHCRAAEFCALRQNHLGSTMLVFGTQSTASSDVADNGTLKAAYDYHAFGEQLTLVEPTDKVTENFTGKGIRGERCDSRVYSNWHCRAEEHCAQRNEKDDEIELNNFGARYLDPMLGLWISVDPARQFSSPYLYAGNGMNPVNVVDPDGNYSIENVDGKLGFFYSNLVEHLVYGVYNNFIPFSGLYTSKMREGELKNTLKPSKTEGVFSAVVDAVSLGIGRLFKVSKPIYYAFKASEFINKANDVYEFIQTNPLFEIYMADLTSGSNSIFALNENELKEKVEWATTYGLDLYNKGTEINEDVKKQFHTDYIDQFGYDGE